jgi:predicted transcriptional regulator
VVYHIAKSVKALNSPRKLALQFSLDKDSVLTALWKTGKEYEVLRLQTFIFENGTNLSLKGQNMPSSILEQYIDVAKTLMEHGPLSINELMALSKANQSSLKEQVNFLADQKMIIVVKDSSSVAYSITERGIKILQFFKVQTLIKPTTHGPKSNSQF